MNWLYPEKLNCILTRRFQVFTLSCLIRLNIAKLADWWESLVWCLLNLEVAFFQLVNPSWVKLFSDFPESMANTRQVWQNAASFLMLYSSHGQVVYHFDEKSRCPIFGYLACSDCIGTRLYSNVLLGWTGSCKDSRVFSIFFFE